MIIMTNLKVILIKLRIKQCNSLKDTTVEVITLLKILTVELFIL